MRQEGQTVILEWRGQGTLQSAVELSGPWEDISTPTNQYSDTTDTAKRFFRVVNR
jgi:hypothetical protein